MEKLGAPHVHPLHQVIGERWSEQRDDDEEQHEEAADDCEDDEDRVFQRRIYAALTVLWPA